MSISSAPQNASKWSPTKVPKSASDPLSPLKAPRSFPVNFTSLTDVLDIVQDHGIGRHKEHLINGLLDVVLYKKRKSERQLKAAVSNLKTLLNSKQIQGLLNEPVLPDGRYPLDVALEGNSPLLFKLLIKHGAKKATDFKTSLFKMESGKELLRNAASYDLASLKDVKGRTLAMRFTEDNDIDELKMLANALNNEGFNAADNTGKTVLDYIPYKRLKELTTNTITAHELGALDIAKKDYRLMVELYNKIMPLLHIILPTDVRGDQKKFNTIEKTVKATKSTYADFEKKYKEQDWYPNLKLYSSTLQAE